MKEAVYRHYYKKLKKILRGKAIPQYNDFSPGDLLFRGQARAQTDELLKSGATKSNGSGVVSSLGDKDKTYATTRLKLARVFAGRGAAFTKTPDGYKRHAGEIISFVKQKDPGYQQARKRLGSFRDTSKPSMRQGSINDDVLALSNPIMKDELRGILVKQGGAKHGYRPLTLREARERGFSAKLRLRELARGDFLRQVIGYYDLVPARRTSEAVKGAGKLRYYRSNPVGKEIERVRKEILVDLNLRESSKFKDTPGLTVVDEYDEAHHFPRRSRDTKYVIDNLNKHAARGKSWSVKKGMLGQPIVRAEGIERILSAKLRLRELAARSLAAGSLRLIEMGYTKPGLRERIKARIMASSKGGRPGQWSARKAQLVAQEYRAEGGGYKGGKTESQKSLRKWTREKWGTRSGKPSTQGPDATGERYLPEKAHKSLSPQEYGATTRAKREGSRRGEQFVKQPERIAKKTARHR